MRELKFEAVRLTLQVDHEQFDDATREEYLRDLRHLVGCAPSQVKGSTFRTGCIIHECKLPRPAVTRLLELFRAAAAEPSKDDPVDVREARDFFQKYATSELEDFPDYHVEVSTPRGRDRTVVFVHGWLGGRDSFGSIPEEVSRELKCRTLRYEYPTGWFAESPSLTSLSRNLDFWVRDQAARGSLSFVAHSMGGLVTKKLLSSELWRGERLGDRVTHLAFAATPHYGAALAVLGKHLPWFKKKQLRAMDTGAAELAELNEQWSAWTADRVPSRCVVRCYYSESDKAVSPQSAIGPHPTDAVPLFGVGHVSIVKDGSPLLAQLLSFLRSEAEAAGGQGSG